MKRNSVNPAALRTIRQLQGLSVRALAAKSDISHSYLLAIEAGRKIPLPGVAMRLAKELGVTLSSFYALGEHTEVIDFTQGSDSSVPA